MQVIFSHGKESGPWGSKITLMAALADSLGFETESIDYRDLKNPESRVERLIDFVNGLSAPPIHVGSSMGGYVATMAACNFECQALFLLAPALYLYDPDRKKYPIKAKSIEVIHGWSDDVILPKTSIRFAEEENCELHLIPGDHRLNSSMEVVLKLFKAHLERQAAF